MRIFFKVPDFWGPKTKSAYRNLLPKGGEYHWILLNNEVSNAFT